METKHIQSSLYYINFGNSTCTTIDRSNWFCASSISDELFDSILKGKHNCYFLENNNVFSHNMNILRKLLHGSDAILVVGTAGYTDIFKHANVCIINTEDNSIIVENTKYIFGQFDYHRDTSEILEYNINTKEICGKPDYYYHPELSSIISRGYNLLGKEISINYSVVVKKDGRIWKSGLIFPEDLFNYFNSNRSLYFRLMKEYVFVLQKLYSLRDIEHRDQEIVDNLVLHYYYSSIIGLIVPDITNALLTESGISVVEEIYQLFINNSPISDINNLTENSLKSMTLFMNNLVNGMNDSENFLKTYNAKYNFTGSLAEMYFVTNMLTDLRRCVIDILIHNNSWFRSICNHRSNERVSINSDHITKDNK